MARTSSGLIVPDDKGTSYTPQSMPKEAFTGAFAKESYTHPETGKVTQRTSMTPNWDTLMSSPQVRSGAANLVNMYKTAVENPAMLQEGQQYYQREHSRLSHVGEQFNAVRAQRGMKTYHEENPMAAGLLLAGSYSLNNSEKNRDRLVNKAATTGDTSGHLGTRIIDNAIETGKHPMDIFASMGGGHGLKLYDYSGSIAHPGAWHGEWGGTKRGTGHTIDRHQHDIVMGEKMGQFNRPLSSSDTNIRRYRAFQASHMLAQHGPGGTEELYGHKDSPDTFQAVTWGPWRGGYK